MIEAALLSSPQPLKLEALVRLFGGTMKKSQVQEQLARLQAAWQTRGLRLVETVDGWRFQCVSDVAQALMRISGQKPPKYSRAVLETLAIIAYRQPATRGDIEEIRGVAVNANVMRQLEERGWIEVVGHRETPGRPRLFATTKQFLTDLGLKSLSDLSREDLAAEKIVKALRKYGLVERTDIIAFSLNACLAFKKLLPDSKIYYLDGDLTPKKIKKLGLAGIDYSIEALRKHPEWVEQAHKLGLEVNVWTVDKEEDMRYFIDLGVDYITTNYPEQLQQLIGEK